MPKGIPVLIVLTWVLVFKRWGDFSFFKNLLLEQIEGAVVLFTSFNLGLQTPVSWLHSSILLNTNSYTPFT